MIALLVVLACVAAGCGDSRSGTRTFGDTGKFETYMAGYLSVPSVSCDTTGETAARCRTPDGVTYLVLCESVDEAGGHNCTVTRQD